MKMLIAVSGKGGTGKTTFAGMVIRLLCDKKVQLLAIDADPNNNLWQTLGLEEPQTIMDIVEDIQKGRIEIPKGVTKDRFISLKIQESLFEADCYDLLSMGRPEGPGCYCYANNLLRDTIDKLMKAYVCVVVDNEAGMEHLSRRLVSKIDNFFVISDYSIAGIRSAKNIFNIVKGLRIEVGKSNFIINKATGPINSMEEELKRLGLDVAGVIPYDEEVGKISVSGKSIFDLPKTAAYYKSVEKIVGKIL